jgi:hypothetical protein
MPCLKNPSRQFSLEPGVNNPFNHSSLRPLNLFNQPSAQSSTSLESLNLFQLSSVQCGLEPSHQFSLESGVSNPFNHSGLKPLNLSNQPSVQSSTSLESLILFQLSSVRSTLDLFYQSSHNQSHQLSVESSLNPSHQFSLRPFNPFNLSSVQFGLDLFYQPSRGPQASSPLSNGGI